MANPIGPKVGDKYFVHPQWNVPASVAYVQNVRGSRVALGKEDRADASAPRSWRAYGATLHGDGPYSRDFAERWDAAKHEPMLRRSQAEARFRALTARAVSGYRTEAIEAACEALASGWVSK